MKLAKINGNKPALVIGLYVAVLHIIWAIAVALGIGQASLDWVLPLHFVSNTFTLIDFSFINAVILAIVGFIGGYVGTWVFVWIWNAMKK